MRFRRKITQKMKQKKVLVFLTIQFFTLGTYASANQVNVYSLLNNRTRERLITANENEYKSLISENKNWIITESSLQNYNTREVDTVPVYRLFNPHTGEHFYTINVGELNELISKDSWLSEGIAFYALQRGTKPVYRLFKIGHAHVFTHDEKKKQELLESGWVLEGIAWYQKVSQEGKESKKVNSPLISGFSETSNLPEGFQVLQFPAQISEYPRGGSYPWGQCTWYTYYRAQELGIHFSPQMGNGGDWQYASGYEVSHIPITGSALSFSPGQAGADSTYGHVAFVEEVRGDGSILISESNVRGIGRLSYRTFTAEEAQQFHYVIGK